MWTKFSQRPNCKKPIIKEFLLGKDGHETHEITCKASRYPVTNITLVYNKTRQRLTVPGLEERNSTSVTQTTLKPI